jgi:hypothetical protein
VPSLRDALIMQSELNWIVERLRNSGLLPSFVTPFGAEAPPELKSDKRVVTRVVGRHSYAASTANDRGEGGHGSMSGYN